MTSLLCVSSHHQKNDYKLIDFISKLIDLKNVPEKSPLHSGGVQNNAVLLVVSRVAQDGDDGVDAGGEISEPQVLHGTSGDQRLVRIVEYVR